MTVQRRTGTLRPHLHVDSQTGWDVIPDISPDHPYAVALRP
jgi:hypothetical protein